MVFHCVRSGGRAGLHAERQQHLAVEALGRIGLRHGVDVVDVARLDHGALAHVAEQRELPALLLRDRPVGAAEQDVRLDADREQFLDRMLGRLGLEFARARDIGHQREVDVDGVVARQFVAELPDRLQKRQALDIADRAADLDHDEVVALVAVADEVLDRVGDVRNHLDGRTEIVAAPLLGQDVLIDAAGGDVVLPIGGPTGKALVMAEVEIGLRPVIGNEALAVLVRRHRARIDVEIGVELSEPHRIAAGLQHRAERGRCQTLAER